MAKDKEEAAAAPEATITVPAAQLQEILDNLKAKDEAIANLTAAVSQNKLAQVINAKKPKELPRVFLKVFQGKVVTSWKTATSRYIYGSSSQSPIGEVLQSEYFFSDGTSSGVLDQVVFTREDTRLWCRLQEGIKAIQDPDVHVWTLVAEGLESADEDLRNSFVMPVAPLQVDRNFVNP